MATVAAVREVAGDSKVDSGGEKSGSSSVVLTWLRRQHTVPGASLNVKVEKVLLWS